MSLYTFVIRNITFIVSTLKILNNMRTNLFLLLVEIASTHSIYFIKDNWWDEVD